LVEVLKAEKPRNDERSAGTSNKTSSQRSLGELERTISALKSVIEKLQTENKRLKKPGVPQAKPSTSTEKLKVQKQTLYSCFIQASRLEE
jgi:predicted RNase H-like nuclease (RuvC/YqgF family)